MDERGITEDEIKEVLLRGELYEDLRYANTFVKYDPSKKIAVSFIREQDGILIKTVEGPGWKKLPKKAWRLISGE